MSDQDIRRLNLDAVDKFRLYYRTNYWGDSETVSGDSSRLEKTQEISELLDKIFFPYGLTLVDLGCGDCNWMSKVDLATSAYIGIDVVPELVRGNSARFESGQRSFSCLDIRRDELPRGDAYLVRDVLSHLSDNDVMLVLDSIKRAGPGLLLASTFRGADPTRLMDDSSYASIDLELDRYGLGPADGFIPEQASNTDCSEQRGIGIWLLKGSTTFVEELRSELADILRNSFPYEPKRNRLVVTPQSWSIKVDGRGYAYISESTRVALNSDRDVEIVPLYVPVGNVERRLTKLAQAEGCSLVLGTHCVGVVKSSLTERFTNGDLVLATPVVDGDTGLIGPGIRSDGCLRSKVVVSSGRLLHLDGGIEPYKWLAAAPLTIILSASTFFDAIEEEEHKPSAYIWGAGTLGLLFAWYLCARSWNVTVVDVYNGGSWIAESIRAVGATYVGPRFDSQPKDVPSICLDVTSDSTAMSFEVPSLSNRMIIVDDLDGHRKTIGWGAPTPLFFPPFVPDRIDAAIEMISSSRDASVWSDIVGGLYPYNEFDHAIFPASPTRTQLIDISSIGDNRGAATGG